MSNIIALTSVLLKNNLLGGTSKNHSTRNKKDKSVIVYAIILIVYFLIFSVPIVFVLKDLLANYDFSELILSFIVPFGGVTSLIFAFFSITSVFYFNKDSETLLPLPIKSSELLIAKFLTSLLSEYFILLMFIFPIIFGVGMGINASATYYLYAAGICALMPVVPSVIVSIIIMLLNKVINIGKRKNLFMYLMIALILCFSLGYGLVLGGAMEMDISELAALFSGETTSIIEASRYIFPFFNSGSYALYHSDEFIGLASFITFIGINLLAMIILYFVGDKLYIKGLTKSSGNKKNKVDISSSYNYEKGTTLTMLMRKEWRSICRTPIYMLNIVIMNILMPVVLIITFLISYSQTKAEFAALNVDFSSSSVYLIIICAVMFMSTLGGAVGSSSAISREGKDAIYMKVFPIDLKKQIDAKVYFATLLDVVVALIAEIPFMIMLKIPLYYLLIVNIPLLFMILLLNYINVLLDLRKPKLAWSDEAEAVKQNITSLIGVVITLLVSGFIAVLAVLLWNNPVNIFVTFLIFTSTMVLCYILMAIYIKKNANKLFSKVM